MRESHADEGRFPREAPTMMIPDGYDDVQLAPVDGDWVTTDLRTFHAKGAEAKGPVLVAADGDWRAAVEAYEATQGPTPPLFLLTDDLSYPLIIWDQAA